MLKALRDYYYNNDSLNHDPRLDEVPLLGIVELNHDGTPAGFILNHQEDEIFTIRVPNQVKRSSGVKANFLVDKGSYIFGRDQHTKRTRRSEAEFLDFRKINLEALEDLNGEMAVVFRKFLNLPIDYPDFEKYSREISGVDPKVQKAVWIAFRIYDQHAFIHDDAKILESVHRLNQIRQSSPGFSLLSGQEEPIIRLHPNIKGLPGSSASGSSLISFNEDSVSFNYTGQEQGMLSPIGYEDALAISKSLNYLIRNNNQRIDRLSILCFSNASKDCETIIEGCFQWGDNCADEDQELKAIIEQITVGQMPRLFIKDPKLLSQEDRLKRENYFLDKPFYIIGIQPNAGRVSPLFFYRDTFGKLIENFISFYNAASIETVQGLAQIRLKRMIGAHKSLKRKRESCVRKTETALIESIIFGRRIPKAYYTEVLEQINRRRYLKTAKDRAIDQRMEIDQMSLVKAYLIRNTNQFKNGELRMGLNCKCTNTAYLLGRIFAICDQAEGRKDQRAMRYKLQSKASKNPAAIYPLILEKTNIRLRNTPGKAIYFGRLIGEVMDLLEVDEYPVALNQEEQGSWWIGFYQQRQELFKKKVQEDQTDREETEEKQMQEMEA